MPNRIKIVNQRSLSLTQEQLVDDCAFMLTMTHEDITLSNLIDSQCKPWNELHDDIWILDKSVKCMFSHDTVEILKIPK